ncbi:two component transcriptional regulator, LuxR family [Caenispirillum bisanense]|uniref:Two component transcriptional regulator, LuxR family n=1 Tax=Caenispirillum bisanense TaxID=414052 RepID=A0A286GDU4_9PROT|nr:response regulator transcription factor [Caenispirillum bisanense]SOD93681.1 two component transcriptional regulator, LuxR family [Caenispirillum bisanense]
MAHPESVSLPAGGGTGGATALPAILIADDHPLFREALHQVVTEAFADFAVRLAKDFEQAMAAVCEDDGLELVLLDLNMPGMNGFNGLIALRNQVPMVPIVVVSASETAETAGQVLTFGASGFLPKSLSKGEMAAALRRVLDGDVYLPPELEAELETGGGLSAADRALVEQLGALTHQQRKVLEMLVAGKSNKVIAYELDIAESTVKAHVSAILRKLGVTSRTQAVITAGRIIGRLPS